MLSASQRSTWLTTPQAENIAYVQRGCQPGHQLADVIFNISMRPTIEQAHSSIDSSEYAVGLNLHPPSAGFFAQQNAAVDATAKDGTAFVDDA
eukprot:11115724-Karenia_brevis.AAC.1